ncbi:MAG: CatB-related O-acetyltransferase [Bacteroidaceae bacterium]|nr:CatB-related O-acetyltransferase [Bacteroidaceae bacterium]
MLSRIIDSVRYSISKRMTRYRKLKTWQKYGDLTKYHISKENIKVGEHTYGVPEVVEFDAVTKLRIGAFCSIAKGVTILLGGNHGRSVATFPFYKEHGVAEWNGINEDVCRGDIQIGNDVWIGYGALILSGVTIGDGAIIGGGSVVSKDIPPYAIAVGSPIRVIKYRYSAETIEAMREIAWWNWSDEKITSYIKCFDGPVEDFIAEARRRGDL